MRNASGVGGGDTGRSYWLTVGVLISLIVLAFFGSFLVGRYPVSPRTVLDIVISRFMRIEPYWDRILETVVLQVRIPRIALALLVGGSLSISGASYQTLFKNPMVSPDLLGVSAGAGFGAAIAMLNNANGAGVQACALLFGLIAVGATYMINISSSSKHEMTTLVLAGVVISSLFQALLNVVKTLADTDSQLPSITFWLMGSLGRGNVSHVLMMLIVTIFCVSVLFFFRNQINALSAGTDEAKALGVNVRLVSAIIVVCSTLLTVISVSTCGIVGWIGMIIPHISRYITGAQYGKLATVSFLIGALFLLMIDNVIRCIQGVELPLGVLTALVGTPIFAALLMKRKKEW